MASLLLDRPSWVSDQLYPFTSRFVDISGCRVHYVDEGQGPILLMLHGNPTWSFLYRNLIHDLSQDFRCIAPDYPGFGLSKHGSTYDFTPASHAGVIEDFIRKLDLTAITLIVQDWGGPIGLGVAGRNPERFRGIVLGNTWAWPLNGDLQFELFSRLMGGLFGGFLIRHFNAFVNVALPLGVCRNRLSPSTMEMYRKPFEKPDARKPTHVFPGAILSAAEYLSQIHSGLSRISHLPTLITWGDCDPAFRRKERSHFQKVFPNHKIHVLKGAGHYIQEDAPKEICDHLRSWWRTTKS